ncbi:MAG: CHC2 zinc finger domain-containing protein [Chloroflexota bacterium]|nr:CHC2 zinc finger domain-containing protein [Chloroflexota bacterium]
MYDVRAIRNAHAIEDVASDAGVELRPVGGRLLGRCPFHRDERPSLVVYPHNRSYFCFGCGAGGDVIDFVARLREVEFKEAAAMLAGPSTDQRGRKRAPPQIARSTRERHAQVSSQAEVEVIDAAASFYHDALWRSREALAYLAARGIDRSTAHRCRLGFACHGLADYLRRDGLSLAAARRVGLLVGEEGTMLGRIVIPDVHAGKARWLTGRALGQATPRYLNLRLPTPLLGLGLVRGDEVVVTEGPFDWLTGIQWNLPTVALLGTHTSRSTVQTLARFRRVYLALDADEAGHRAAARLTSALRPRAIAVELPPGVHDLNDLGRSPAGREAFQRCLEDANRRREER